jgi:hypothetical protein
MHTTAQLVLKSKGMETMPMFHLRKLHQTAELVTEALMISFHLCNHFII